MVHRGMDVSATTSEPGATDADTIAVATFKDEDPPAGAPAELRELLSSGEASRAFKALALAHADGKRWLSVGLGARDDFTPESARVAALRPPAAGPTSPGRS
jgi:leucyl aminopeptidase